MNDATRKALEAARGYLLNAKIDLETGAPKRTAIATLEGGLKIIDAALATPSGFDEGIEAAGPTAEEIEDAAEGVLDAADYLKTELDSDEPEILESKWLGALMSAHGVLLGIIEARSLATRSTTGGERESIVAWLRTVDQGDSTAIAMRAYANTFADYIERGDHLPPGGGGK